METSKKNPTSLLAQCLKAKYFPHIDILHARLGYNSSFAWNNIFHSIWVIQKGGCWKIGDGNDVKIWEDNWLPFQNGYELYTKENNSAQLYLVRDLMEDHSKEWNQTKIANTFLDFEGEQINQIPLIHEDIYDSLMWLHTKDGNYSVKSGYNLIREWVQNKEQGTSNTVSMQKLWKTVWSLNTIPRHKDFLWRVLNEVVPVRHQLHNKGLAIDMFCPRCVTKIETLNHSLMECPYARKVWFGSTLNIKFPDYTEYNFSDWLYEFILTQDNSTLIYTSYGLCEISTFSKTADSVRKM